MSDEKDAIRKQIEISEKAADRISDGAAATQNAVFTKIRSILKELKIRNDEILISRENLRLLRQLREELRFIIINPAYVKKVDTLIGTFERMKKINDNYFGSKFNNYNANSLSLREITNQAIASTRSSLLESGIDARVIQPVINLLNQGITQGMNIQEMEDALRVEIIGIEKGANKRFGSLQLYVKQIVRDSLNQFARNYVQTNSKTLGLVWYYYDGSLVRDSRSYCIERAGKYFHKKEVQDSASKVWAGKIPQTNEATIFTYCGGYNCRHEYMPVLIDVVPARVVQRNIDSGNYEPPS